MAIGFAITGITKNVVFSTRRADRARNADNIAVSLGNADIASGQIKNAIGGVETLAKESKTSLATGFKGAQAAIKAMSASNPLLEGASKVIGFTAENINPVITAVGGIKVLCADDKESELINEGLGLATMFAFEGAAKNILEMEKVEKDVLGNKISKKRTAFYKSNPFLKVQSEKIEKAITDYCETKQLFNKISLKHAPGIAKGLLFVGASITGYKLGNTIGKKINEHRKENKNAKTIPMRQVSSVSNAA